MQFDSNTLQNTRGRAPNSIVHQTTPHASAMSDSLQIFTQDIGGQNVAVSALMVDGNPWFRGNDIATALGYARPRDAVRNHIDEEDRETHCRIWGASI